MGEPPRAKDAEYEALLKKLEYFAARKKAPETWKKPKSPAADKLVATVNSDLTKAILEYRQQAEKPRVLSPRGLAYLVYQGHASGDKEVEPLVIALKGLKPTLSLTGFIARLSDKPVEEEKKAPAPLPPVGPGGLGPAPVLVQNIPRAGDAFAFPQDVVGADAQLKWAYDQSQLPGKGSLLFFLRYKPSGRQELVAVDDGWLVFRDGQTGAALPIIYTRETIHYYNPAKDDYGDNEYVPQEVKVAKGGIPGGEYPVELSNGILGCGWDQVAVNGELVTLQAGGRLKAGAYRVQVRDNQNFRNIVNPVVGQFAYTDLALTYGGQPCSLDNSWDFEFGHIVADPDRYLDQAKDLLTTWSDGGLDDTGIQYMYADLDPLTGIEWTDGQIYDIPLHVSVETLAFDEKLKQYIKRGDAPKPGYFKDMGFHVTVAYYTLNNPTGYDRRNARAFRNGTGWATTDGRVKNALAAAGYSFTQVLAMGQKFLNENI